MGKKNPWTRITDTIDRYFIPNPVTEVLILGGGLYIRLYGLGYGLCSSYSLTPVHIL